MQNFEKNIHVVFLLFAQGTAKYKPPSITVGRWVVLVKTSVIGLGRHMTPFEKKLVGSFRSLMCSFRDVWKKARPFVIEIGLPTRLNLNFFDSLSTNQVRTGVFFYPTSNGFFSLYPPFGLPLIVMHIWLLIFEHDKKVFSWHKKKYICTYIFQIQVF